VNSDLGKRISLEKQFLANSGKRLHTWPTDSVRRSNKGNDLSIEELRAQQVKHNQEVINRMRVYWTENK
jgi:hypothetical protein